MDNEKNFNGQQGQNPEPKPEPPKVVENPGVFKRAFRTVTAPVRWAYREVAKSPVGTGIGMVVGSALTLGGRALIKYLVGLKGGGTDFIPAETAEVKIEDVPTVNTID